jgi:hypothetical protein
MLVFYRWYNTIVAYLSGAKIWTPDAEVLFILEILVHITTTVISGCIVAYFAHWLRNRNDK